MARPDIPDEQKKRVEEIHQQARGYPAKSFQEAVATLVVLAEDALHEDTNSPREPPESLFQYDLTSTEGQIRILITPHEDSSLSMKSKHVAQESRPVIETPKTTVHVNDVTSKLEEIEGVDMVPPLSSRFEIHVSKDFEGDIERLVSEIFGTIKRTLKDAEIPIDEMEKELRKHANPSNPNH